MTESASQFPDGLVSYKRTPDFTEETIPAGLLKEHSTKDGTWGLIHVTHGELVYRVTDSRREPYETILSPGIAGIVEPGIMHEVQPNGAIRFFVEFYR